MALPATGTERAETRWTLDPEIVALLPEQGAWSERDYLWLTERTNRLVELAGGRIEVLPMPTDKHQAILQFLLFALHALLARSSGVVRCAPLRLRLATGRYREPDLLALRSAGDSRRGNDFWTGADLVVEIVSPNDPERDLVTKRAEYAIVGIPEYWIVDPRNETVIVLALVENAYVEQGVFGRGSEARSVSFPDFAVGVAAIFDAE
jgi:Uma2 family endonuclease